MTETNFVYSLRPPAFAGGLKRVLLLKIYVFVAF